MRTVKYARLLKAKTQVNNSRRYHRRKHEVTHLEPSRLQSSMVQNNRKKNNNKTKRSAEEEKMERLEIQILEKRGIIRPLTIKISSEDQNICNQFHGIGVARGAMDLSELIRCIPDILPTKEEGAQRNEEDPTYHPPSSNYSSSKSKSFEDMGILLPTPNKPLHRPRRQPRSTGPVTIHWPDYTLSSGGKKLDKKVTDLPTSSKELDSSQQSSNLSTDSTPNRNEAEAEPDTAKASIKLETETSSWGEKGDTTLSSRMPPLEFVCKECAISFPTTASYLSHRVRIHGGDNTTQSTEPNSDQSPTADVVGDAEKMSQKPKLTFHDVLRKYGQTKSVNSVQRRPMSEKEKSMEKLFGPRNGNGQETPVKCPYCGIVYGNRDGYRSHKSRKHRGQRLVEASINKNASASETESASNPILDAANPPVLVPPKPTLKCGLCESETYFPTRVDLCAHLENPIEEGGHDTSAKIQTAVFDNFLSFERWRARLELETGVDFRKTNGNAKKRDSRGHTYYVLHYSCNRSGVPYKPKKPPKPTKTGKIRKSNRNGYLGCGFTCSAFIRAEAFTETGKIEASFCKDHYKHDRNPDLQHMTQAKKRLLEEMVPDEFESFRHKTPREPKKEIIQVIIREEPEEEPNVVDEEELIEVNFDESIVQDAYQHDHYQQEEERIVLDEQDFDHPGIPDKVAECMEWLNSHMRNVQDKKMARKLKRTIKSLETIGDLVPDDQNPRPSTSSNNSLLLPRPNSTPAKQKASPKGYPNSEDKITTSTPRTPYVPVPSFVKRARLMAKARESVLNSEVGIPVEVYDENWIQRKKKEKTAQFNPDVFQKKLFFIKLDMSVCDKSQIDVKAVGDKLHISSSFLDSAESGQKGGQKFSQTLYLPGDLQIEKMESYLDEKGILTITAPKKDANAPEKEIPIVVRRAETRNKVSSAPTSKCKNINID